LWEERRERGKGERRKKLEKRDERVKMGGARGGAFFLTTIGGLIVIQ